jgi:glucose/arabinose dehydrogenase
MVTLVDGLRAPRSVAQLPDRRLLIAERAGALLLIDSRGGQRALEGTPSALLAGDGGYLDVAIDRRFAENRRIHLSYAAGTPGASTLAIFSAHLVEGELRDASTLLRVIPGREVPRHFGGGMLQLADDSLLLTVGDGLEHHLQAQSLRSELGKVLRVDARGAAATDNPFRTPGATRIWTLGHGNPARLAYDVDADEVFLYEPGAGGGGELNHLQRSRNYGWPLATHGTSPGGAYVSPFRELAGMTSPLWVWPRDFMPTGMAWYPGGEFTHWRGSLLVSGVRDGAGALHRLRVRAGRVVDEEWLTVNGMPPLQDLRVFPDGGIHLLTRERPARLLRLLPAR